MKTINHNNQLITVYNNGQIFNNTNQKFISFSVSNGYLRGRIGNKREYLHRLLAKCFIDNFDEKLCVNHIDGNKLNNDISNLEVITLAENTKHAHITKLNDNKGIKNKSSKLSKNNAIEIFNSADTYMEIAKKYNISISTISLIKNKKKWKSIHP